VRLASEALINNSREMFELVRDHWWAVKQYAETHRVRSVAIVDRASAEQLPGGWPPPIYIRYRGKEYGVGTCQPTFGNPALQARLGEDPRRVRVLVMLRPAVAGPTNPSDAREYLFHLDRGPAGTRLAGGDRPPGK
jgi:hypothetical protein